MIWCFIFTMISTWCNLCEIYFRICLLSRPEVVTEPACRSNDNFRWRHWHPSWHCDSFRFSTHHAMSLCNVLSRDLLSSEYRQATGLDAWASRVKCPARFVSHLHEICIYIWVVYSLCFFCCLFITVTWWYVWCIEWASGNQEEVQACLVTLWLFIISCYSLYKTTLGLLCSWFENHPHFHKYAMDFHV